MSFTLPPFCPLAEGIMAFLASRPHDWSYWEITELRDQQTDDRPREVILTLNSKNAHGTCIRQRVDSSASPSLIVQNAIKALSKKSNPPLKNFQVLQELQGQSNGFAMTKNSLGDFREGYLPRF